MKRFAILALTLLMLFSTAAAQPPTIEETIYRAFGAFESDPYIAGVFKIETFYPTYPNTVWYRMQYSNLYDPLTQVGNAIFTYSQLEALFENNQIDSFHLVFCYDHPQISDKYLKVLMAIMDRQTFEAIDPDYYDSSDFPVYVKLRYALRLYFPTIQMLIEK